MKQKIKIKLINLENLYDYKAIFSFITIIIVIISSTLIIQGTSFAKVTGYCSNCHTMHNSQNGAEVPNFDGSTGANEALTLGTCIGCHGQGGGNMIEIIAEGTPGESQIPQVYHTYSGGDLAGGNFAYVTGAKGSGASDTKGHNIDPLNPDDNLFAAPGYGHPTIPDLAILTCSGRFGCHGYPDPDGSSGIEGAHHKNIDGKCNIADEVYNSYRFLLAVKGLENTNDKWMNVDENSHNEYYGKITPQPNSSSYCNTCHVEFYPSFPTDLSISRLCATCHGNFHALSGLSSDPGIGGNTSSPFVRHPTDILIKNQGEYAVANRAYNVQAPVGRTTVPDNIINIATDNDVVTCLSCHVAHASNYPDLLRWDYDNIIAGGGGADGTGCFICHTSKDGS